MNGMTETGAPREPASPAEAKPAKAREPRAREARPAAELKVFDRWTSAVGVTDPGLRAYINLAPRYLLHDQGRHARRPFGKSGTHIVERLINTLMRGGTGEKTGGRVIRDRGGCGKKGKMYRVVRNAFEIVAQKSGKNPIEVLVRAIEAAAPREETTRVKYGGIMYHLAVDTAPARRLDFALRNIGKAVAMRSFDSPKSATAALAEELLLAAANDAQSHAIARRIEVERTARASR